VAEVSQRLTITQSRFSVRCRRKFPDTGCSGAREGGARKFPPTARSRIPILTLTLSGVPPTRRPTHPQSHPMLPSWKKPRSKTQTTATPSPAPTPPEESFIRKKFSIPHRDVKALAASSIPVASSIGSRFLSNDRTSYSEEERVTNTSRSDNATTDQKPGPHQAAVSAWQTAYSTAKMVVNITKESSDMFPPLKAVVGALSVLIQNYDVSPILVAAIEMLC